LADFGETVVIKSLLQGIDRHLETPGEGAESCGQLG
jgi:hypothetical protein